LKGKKCRYLVYYVEIQIDKKHKVDQSTFMANFGGVNVDFKTGIYVLNEILI